MHNGYAKIKTQITFTVTTKLISIFLFPKQIVQLSEISSVCPFSVAVQHGFCQTRSKTATYKVFSYCITNDSLDGLCFLTKLIYTIVHVWLLDTDKPFGLYQMKQ